jgi:peptidase A4-like protein
MEPVEGRPVRRLVSFGLLTLLATAVLGTASGPAFAGAPVSDLHRIDKSRTDSTNWSGYAAYDATFSHVEGDWNVPTADCSQMKGQQLSIAAVFVGLDGYDSGTVEQGGTDTDCIGTTPYYTAWYEFYPERAFFLDPDVYPVDAGDHMHGEVSVSGGSVTVTLDNESSSDLDWPFTSPSRPASGLDLSSAEWILEAPSNKLTKFSGMDFFNASATAGATTGDIDTFTNDNIRMVKKGRPFSPTPRATPSSLTSGGSAFSVTWNNY